MSSPPFHIILAKQMKLPEYSEGIAVAVKVNIVIF
jgi:hypothetical protein